jgi:hypothetical protein
MEAGNGHNRLLVRAAQKCLLIVAIPLLAVIVDRIAITVGDKVITDSEIDLRIRLAAFQNDLKPDFSLASRRQAAQKLIDQKLVEREMDVGRYPRLGPDVGKKLLAEYDKSNYKSKPEAMDAALRAYGLTPGELQSELAWQTELLTFLNLRFRPAVQVTDQDVQKYFDEEFSKGERKNQQVAEAGALNEMRAEIEQKLTNERADKELDMWLLDQRKRTKIDFEEKDLAENPK